MKHITVNENDILQALFTSPHRLLMTRIVLLINGVYAVSANSAIEEVKTELETFRVCIQ